MPRKKQHAGRKRGGDGSSRDGGKRPQGKLRRKEYEELLANLQVELVKLQDWVKSTGARVIVVFEGRDAAGKGGVIKRITERVSPRIFRSVALPTPTEREKTQIYLQRYIAHFPSAGEVVLFDRSWYNRAGVERVMGFCSDAEYRSFLRVVPGFERWIVVEEGILLLKYWLTVSNKEQERRFQKRVEDPLRQWKLSPMDLESRRRWYEYSAARDAMMEATDTDWAPWHIVRSDDKRRARLNCICHLLTSISYEAIPRPEVRLPKRSTKRAYDDEATLGGRKFVPERY